MKRKDYKKHSLGELTDKQRACFKAVGGGCYDYQGWFVDIRRDDDKCFVWYACWTRNGKRLFPIQHRKLKKLLKRLKNYDRN